MPWRPNPNPNLNSDLDSSPNPHLADRNPEGKHKAERTRAERDLISNRHNPYALTPNLMYA